MTTQELMVGDWVQIGEADNYHGYVGKVKIINSITGYVTVFIGDGNLHDVLIDDLEPIQLTPEIFNKNGFKTWPSDGHCGLGDMIYRPRLGENEGKFLLKMMSDIEQRDLYIDGDFQYVHELQHILKQFGIEKEFVL